MTTENYKGLHAHAEAAVKEVFKRRFEAEPNLLSISWNQYTPFFNDGEACTFRVGDPDFTFQDGSVAEEVWNDPWWKEAEDESVFKLVFGDHVKVTAMREGFSVTRYKDHY